MFSDAKNVFPRGKKNLHSPIGEYMEPTQNVKEFR